MAGKEPHPNTDEAHRSPGYRACLLDTDKARTQPPSKRGGRKPERSVVQRATPGRLLLVGADRYVVTAYGSRIQFYR